MAFAAPSPPTEEEAAQLKAQLPALHAAAARAIAAADLILIVTGAGFSAPSGLSTYADVRTLMRSHGRDGIGYNDLCDPDLLRSVVPRRELVSAARTAEGGEVEPPGAKRLNRGGLPDDEASRVELFYGFWGASYNSYRDATPHAGYALIMKWRARLLDPAQHFFSLTTNVDGHWRQFLPHNAVEEFNGTCMLMRCANKQCTMRLAAIHDPHCPHGMWPIPPDLRVRVDETRHVAIGGATLPLVAARGGPGVGSKQPHDAEAFARNHPVCVLCGGRARPAVKMFNDSDTCERNIFCVVCFVFSLFVRVPRTVLVSNLSSSIFHVYYRCGVESAFGNIVAP